MKHTQAIEVKYISPTNTRGSRVQLKDTRLNTKITLSYDYEIGSVLGQAIKHLENNGYNIVCYSNNRANDTYTIMVDSIDNTFKNIKDA
jgi:hypothetical protein